MDKIRIFQLTTDELTEIVKLATMAGISEFIRAAGMVQPRLPDLSHKPVEHAAPDNQKGMKPWMMCDKPGCTMPVKEDDIYCEDHVIRKKKRGRPKKQHQDNIKTSKTPEDSLTIQEAANHLGKSIWFVYDHVKKGDLIHDGSGYRKKVTMVSVNSLASKIKKT